MVILTMMSFSCIILARMDILKATKNDKMISTCEQKPSLVKGDRKGSDEHGRLPAIVEKQETAKV